MFEIPAKTDVISLFDLFDCSAEHTEAGTFAPGDGMQRPDDENSLAVRTGT